MFLKSAGKKNKREWWDRQTHTCRERDVSHHLHLSPPEFTTHTHTHKKYRNKAIKNPGRSNKNRERIDSTYEVIFHISEKLFVFFFTRSSSAISAAEDNPWSTTGKQREREMGWKIKASFWIDLNSFGAFPPQRSWRTPCRFFNPLPQSGSTCRLGLKMRSVNGVEGYLRSHGLPFLHHGAAKRQFLR